MLRLVPFALLTHVALAKQGSGENSLQLEFLMEV